MSNFFEKALNDADKLQEDLLGPDYDYAKQIKSPQELGMGSSGSLSTIANNIKGLKGYTEVLVTGTGNATKTRGPLGNKFFLETGAKCKDTKTGKSETRSVYVNNVPDGSIPFITQGMGVRMTAFRGLVPGMLGNVSNINPMQIFQSFMSGTNPKCQMITMQTVDNNNRKRNESAYVTNVDIRGISPCSFPSKTNPITKSKCNEGFQIIDFNVGNDNIDMPDDALIKMYYSALGLLGIYILFKLHEKSLKLK